jgi:hypothetical protein
MHQARAVARCIEQRPKNFTRPRPAAIAANIAQQNRSSVLRLAEGQQTTANGLLEVFQRWLLIRVQLDPVVV